MKKNQEKLYPHVPSLCNDCQNGCHVLVEMQQEEAKNSKFQPFNSERIDIESAKKGTLPPSKSCVPKMFKFCKMFWLSLLIGSLCIFGAFIIFSMIYIVGSIVFSTNWTKTSVDDHGSKYRYLIWFCVGVFMSLTHYFLLLSSVIITWAKYCPLRSFFFHAKYVHIPI